MATTISVVESFFRAVDTKGPDGPNLVRLQDRGFSARSSDPLIHRAIRAEIVNLVADWLASSPGGRCGTTPDGTRTIWQPGH